MMNLIIDGRHVQAAEGTTILEAAQDVGIRIPTLCYLKDIHEIGACRICVVEIEGRSQLAASCNTAAEDGMVIDTRSEKVMAARRMMLDLLLSNHRMDCFSCGKNGECTLQELCREYGLDRTSYEHSSYKHERRVVDSHPFLSYDPGLCIRCQRCVSMCGKVAGNHTLKLAKAGMFTVMDVPFHEAWKASGCESCGNCAKVCPTGALSEKRKKDYRPWEVQHVRTTCPYCGVGCQFDLLVKANRIVGIEGADGPANHGLLCVKGRFGGFDYIHSPDRIRYPLIKNKATGQFERATWDEALDYTAGQFKALKEKYGGNALAGFACSRSTNEDVYMFQKLVRCGFESNNVDNCARVCHSATVSGLAMTLGSGAMTNPIYDITHDVDCILLIGSNPEEAHPVVGMQIRQAVAAGTKLIVVDPRDIGLTKYADIHLKLRPGTNVAFTNGMIHVILEEHLEDAAFIEARTEGFEALRELVSDYTPERVGELCHIDPDKLREAARLYAAAKKAPIFYCLGVTEHSTGTEGVMSVSNLALVTGKLGRSGCGVNPLRGQNNVQGACDLGASPVDFPGYQKVVNPSVIEKFEKAWHTRLNNEPGIHATDVFPAVMEGKIHGLMICGEDPVVTDPDTHHVIKALEKLDFLVMNELFMTETAKYADVILPGVSYGEKEGTFTNTERRVQRVRKAVTVDGEMRPDSDIFIDLLNRMGYEQPELTPAQIMDEIASVTPSYAGISHERLDSGESLQWPCTDKTHPGTAIMHVGRFSRGKAMFYAARYVPAAELPDEDYPIILMTGRILCHYSTIAMTGRTPGIMEIENSSFIEMNEADAACLGIRDGELVSVSSRRGQIESTARVGRKVSAGECWMPFHFQDGNANWLTNAALDKYARIPEYKVCAVKIEKI